MTKHSPRSDLQYFKLQQLSTEFMQEHPVPNMMDIHQYKGRGYAIALFQYKNCTFAIPLRSKMSETKPKGSYYAYEKSQTEDGKVFFSGLDYQSAVIIPDPKYIINKTFLIKDHQYLQLIQHENFIKKNFIKFIENYIRAVHKKDQNVLKRALYSKSTLPYYHHQLGIDLDIENN